MEAFIALVKGLTPLALIIGYLAFIKGNREVIQQEVVNMLTLALAMLGLFALIHVLGGLFIDWYFTNQPTPFHPRLYKQD